MIEKNHQRDLWNFRLVRLDRAVQVCTIWQLEEEVGITN